MDIENLNPHWIQLASHTFNLPPELLEEKHIKFGKKWRGRRVCGTLDAFQELLEYEIIISKK